MFNKKQPKKNNPIKRAILVARDPEVHKAWRQAKTDIKAAFAKSNKRRK